MSGVSSSTARRIRKGSTLPATCSPGEIFGKTGGGSEGMYFCVTANAWTGPFDVSADSGDFVGPASSTDNAIVRFDGAGGKTGQNSLATVDDNGSINIPAGQTYKINNVALPLDADVVHDTGDETIAGVKTFSSDPIIPDEAYGVGWNGSLEPPTKNAVYDKIEAVISLSWTAVTFQNGWVNFGSGFQVAEYSKDSMGIVHLRGAIASGTLAAAAFTLPVGFRPAAAEAFIARSGAAAGGIVVNTTGTVVPAADGVDTFFSLSGITFVGT